MNIEYQNILNKLRTINVITSSGQINKQCQTILNKNLDVRDLLWVYTNFLGADIQARERIMCIMLNIVIKPSCKVCGASVSFNFRKKRYNTYCPNVKGKSCTSKDVELQNTIKNTLLEKYGVDNALKSESIRERIKQTNQKKYGGNAPICDSNIERKMKDTNFKRYGTQYSSQNDIIKEKIKNTNLEKYGTTSYALSLKDKSVIEKIQNLSYDAEWLREQHHEKGMTVAAMASYLGLSDTIVSSRMKSLNVPIMTLPILENSKHEEDLKEYIQRWLGPDVEVVCCSADIIPPYELNIYIPALNLAFEYNDVYWHGELKGRDRRYHLTKSRLCKEKGIRLVHIWSSEWLYQNELVKSRIRNIIGKSETIYARHCDIVELSQSETNTFLLHNHIQGNCSSSIKIGLKHKEMLVAVMTCGKSRYNKKYEYELLRFCNVSGRRVIGGAGKLLKYFQQTVNPSSIISYSDIRWNVGDLYKSLGFEYSHSASPNYFYFHTEKDTNILHSRIQFQKHKLENVLETFKPELTEWQNMVDNGYDRIWDCGNDVFVWNKS